MVADIADCSLRQHSFLCNSMNRRHLKGSQMRGLKTLLSTTVWLAALALAPMTSAQVVIGIQPACSYGYYDYAPYACAPVGFYGPGYFYNGIFLGMGPWAGWGYSHGWGGHRFSNGGGGRYTGGGGFAANRGRTGGASAVRASNRGGFHGHVSAGGSHAAPARGNTSHGASHGTASRGGAPHAAPHSGGTRGGAAHAGGERR
jgi:hypothetical protein